MKAGRLTIFGYEYERQTGQRLCAQGRWLGEPYRVGARLWIKVPGRGVRALAVLRDGREHLTALGKECYERERCDYVLHVPIIRRSR